MLRWEKFTIDHYPVVEQWWRDWGWAAVLPSMLSDDGIIVYRDDKPIYAGWIYFTQTSLCWFEFVVSDKNATKEEKKGGVDYLIQTAETIMKYNGASMIWHQTNNESLIHILKRNGWVEGDLNCTQVCKRL